MGFFDKLDNMFNSIALLFGIVIFVYLFRDIGDLFNISGPKRTEVTTRPCNRCDGTGIFRTGQTCRKCNGSGEIVITKKVYKKR